MGPRLRRRLIPVVAVAGLLTGFSGGGGSALERLDFTVAGDDKALERSLRGASILLDQQSEKNTEAQDRFADARAEYGRLLSALYAAGHYSAVINVRIDGREASDIAPLDAPEQIGVIAVTVDPGPRFAFGSVRVAPLAGETELPEGFATGEPAFSGTVADAVQAGVGGWREVGFAKTEVTEENVVADHPASVLSVDVTLDPGPRLRFGRLIIEGAERMREDRLRKITGLPEGEVFSVSELERAVDRLRRTGVFSSVTLTEAEGVRAPDLLDITATVVEARTRRYSFGAELATDDGVKLTGGWLHRNLLGGGERLEIGGSITNIGVQEGGIDYALDVTLTRPATPGPDTTAAINFGIGRLDEADYAADTATAGLTFTHIFSTELTARAGLNFDYLNGTDDIGDFEYKSLSLPVGMTWDRRDSKVDATRLFYIDVEAKPFLGFGTTENGIRLAADVRGYRSVGERVVLAARVQAGLILGSSLLGTPRDDLFYSGGGGTVRGQPYQSLGVSVTKDADPLEIGGTHYLGGSLEARVRIGQSLGLVGFFDVGQVGLGFGADEAAIHSGAGVGVRYETGFGPIRLDVATPVSGDTGDGVQFYVGLGQSF